MELTALIPSVCFQFTFLFINPDSSQYQDLPFSKQKGFIMLAGEVIVYFLVFLYLEQVIPNENGTHKHPLFFMKRSNKSKN
jgi:hypothetical protein